MLVHMFEHVPAVSEVDVLTSPEAVATELATSLPRAEDMSALLMLTGRLFGTGAGFRAPALCGDLAPVPGARCPVPGARRAALAGPAVGPCNVGVSAGRDVAS